MAISTDKLGLFLASISDPEELEDLSSLTPRVTPGDRPRQRDDWEYELAATRYPIDHSIVFLAKVRLPVSDLREVVSRLRGAG